MIVFGEVVHEAAAAARAGRNVRISGKRLSGRTTVLRSVTESLTSSGMNVVQASGDRVSAQQPGYALEQVGANLSFTPRTRELSSLVDAFASAVSPRDILAIDDLHLCDPLSLHVISAVRKRVGLRVIHTEVAGRGREVDFPPVWPDMLVTMPDLDLPTSAVLLQSVLGAPIDPRAHAQIYGKVGGIVGLTVALAESAKFAGLLEFDGTLWRARGRRLWNSHLSALLDGLLAELASDERELVRWLAEDGPAPVARIVERFSEATLRRVFEQQFAAPLGEPSGLLIQAWPPLLSSRYQTSLTSAAADAGDGEPPMSFALLGSWPGNELAALAKTFAEHEDRAAREAFQAWATAPTIANALSYLAVGLGLSTETERVRLVFNQTSASPRLGDSVDHIGFAVRRIQWLRLGEQDPDASSAFLSQLIALNPRLESALRGADAALQVLDGSGVSDAVLMEAERPSNEFVLAGRLASSLAVGDLKAVRSGLEIAQGLSDSGFLVGYIEPARLMLAGQARESVRLALEYREKAHARYDRSEYCALSYVAAMGEQYLGDSVRMHQHLAEGTVVGEPSSALSSFYGAMFNLEAGAAHFNGQTQLRDSLRQEAATRLPPIGPFLGMGMEFLDSVIRFADDPVEFGRAVADIVDRSLALRYVVGAIQTAVTGLTIHWNPELVAAFLRAYRTAPLPAYENAASAAALIAANDVDGVRAWVKTLSSAGDDMDLLARLVGSAYRSTRQAGQQELAEALQDLLFGALSAAADAPDHQQGLSARLSAREREIGLLAGELSNPEIAERLGISRRTVENHIANSLKKTKLTNRRDLSTLLTQP